MLGKIWLRLATGMLIASATTAEEAGRFDYREVALDNGLKVITLEDFSCPIVAVHLWYHVGSKDENPERQGFAHMFEHMMFRGTDRLGSTDHFDLIRGTGGTTNAYTSFDQTVYIQTLPANQLDMVLWLEAERMAFLKIDQEAFDTERKVVEEERRLGLNRPYGTALEKVMAEIFQEHPYRWTPIGNIPHLRAASVSELRDFWTRHYVPNNATLVIVGAVSHEDAQASARKAFGWIPRYADVERITRREPPQTAPRDVVIREDNAPAPIVGLLYRTVPARDDDGVYLSMLASILGQGDSSRIRRDLVQERELAVEAIAGHFSLELDGIFGAGAVLSPFGSDAAGVLRELEAHVDRARAEGVTAQELEKARTMMLRDFVVQNLTVESKAGALGQAAVIEGDTSRVNRRIDTLRNATLDDLRRVAQEYLAPERAMRITVERNLLGTIGGMLGLGRSAEDAPITAEPETDPPPPGRAGLSRPADWPESAPLAGLLTTDPLPQFAERRLENGLRVLVVENRELPFVTVQLGLPYGAWSDSKPGTASIALEMISKGTTTRDEQQLAAELDRYAISLSGAGGMDTSSVTAATLSEHVDHAVELLADAVRNPTFPERAFERVRKQTLTGLTMQLAEPSYVAERELSRRMYGPHPYARTATGEAEQVSELDPDDARRWWGMFARPSEATLIFAGDINIEAAAELAREHFGDWRVETPLPGFQMPAIPAPGPTKIYLVDRPGVQAQIRVGGPGLTRRDGDFPIAQVVGSYFGGAFNSRLNETIRVEKGLTYGARGGFSARNLSGEFEISTFSKVASTPEAVQAIFDEIHRLAKEPPSEKELRDTKTYALGSFARQRETPGQVASDLWLIQSQGLPRDYFANLLNAISATTEEDCIRFVRERINPARLTVVVVGPAAELKEPLEAIAPVEIVRPGSDQE